MKLRYIVDLTVDPTQVKIGYSTDKDMVADTIYETLTSTDSWNSGIRDVHINTEVIATEANDGASKDLSDSSS